LDLLFPDRTLSRLAEPFAIQTKKVTGSERAASVRASFCGSRIRWIADAKRMLLWHSPAPVRGERFAG
jgi:hypothetical protein